MRQQRDVQLDHRHPRGVRALFALALAGSVLLALSLAPSAGAQGRDFYGVGSQGAVGSQDFELMQRARVGNMRMLVNWPNLSRLDSLDGPIGGAAARGVRVMPVIYQRPPPVNRAQRRDLANFTASMVRRYGRGGTFWANRPPNQRRPIRSWQILNEMNGPAYWGARPRPRMYARALRMTARAIRRVNPRAEIVLGGMFADPRGRGALRSAQYLRRLYKVKRIKRFFNTVAVHPYKPGIRGVRREVRQFRRIMRRNGHRRGGLRVSEYGWGSAQGRHRLLKGPQGQRRLLRRSFRMFKRNRNRWNLRGVHWFSWQDGNVACPFCGSSGLVRQDRTTKPSFNAFRRVAR